MNIRFAVLLVLVPLAGCLSVPDGIEPVAGFDLHRYLGTWYEIARLDHSFERGLSRVTAQYSLRDDGGVRVINRGYSAAHQRWKEAEGKAYFVNDSERGYLKVSFFGPFYGSYIVFELDRHYQHAFVTGPDRSYLWFLSRTPNVSRELSDHFVATAQRLGFDTKELIFVEHE